MSGGPVEDWASDYDIFDPAYIRYPYPVWDELRQQCPVAHSERWGGSWMPTRYADLFEIARDVQHFSSRNVLVAPAGPPPEDAGPEAATAFQVGAPPITSDPAFAAPTQLPDGSQSVVIKPVKPRLVRR